MGRLLRRLPAVVLGLLTTGIGAALLWWGVQLVALDGSRYYAIAGLALVPAGLLITAGRRLGYWLYVAVVLATVPWALWEVGLDRWGLMARLFAPALLLLLLTAAALRLQPARVEQNAVSNRRLLAFGGVQLLLLGLGWLAVRDIPPPPPAGSLARVAPASAHNWPSYGGDWRADHFSGLNQITPANAGHLERAWVYRVGGLDDLGSNSRFTANPIAVDDTLYLCDPRNVIVALDATSGRARWRHDPHADASKAFSIVCRGVSYHRSQATGACAERILEATLDARLIAVDARTGSPCTEFGVNGAVNLMDGIEPHFDGYYYVTSPPTILGDLAVVGGYVIDNQRVDAARSVIRAFDARTGALRWAWDAGATGPRRPGELFSPGNPNAWTPFSADPALGLIYIPTGMSSPDFFGGLRTPAAEKFGTAIVAINAADGVVRWSFQAVHHDLWDYDMPAQPALTDIHRGGVTIPALAAATKTGQVFLLDRRTGTPVSAVEERPVPRSSAAGERSAPTQPYSTGIPSFAPPRIEERKMWGATPVDQMLCRLRFRSLRYEGDYTPPSVKEMLFSPGTFGALNWGGIAIDRKRGLMIVNASNMPFTGQLVPRAQADAEGAKAFDASSGRPMRPAKGQPMPPMAMEGTPYGLRIMPFLSPIFFPCLAPPWGEIAAVDLASGRQVWRRPFGTTKGLAPFGITLPVGIFNLGGAVTTAGGVTFIGATTDSYFHAIDTVTGRELWRDLLPAGGQATPLTYTGRDGRQMVVIVAGGHGSLRTPRGDYVVAYALPRKSIERHAQ